MTIPDPPRREPLFKIPGVIVGVVALLVVIQAALALLSPDADFTLLARYAFVPGRLTALIHPTGVVERLTAWSASSDPMLMQRFEQARFFLAQTTPVFVTVISYALLHGNWTHIGLNTLWLVAFGTPVARRFGAIRFLLLFLVGAVAGAIVHWLCFPYGFEPVIGASAAVSACMGAAVRFVFQPPPVALAEGDEPRVSPALPFRMLLRDRRALGFVGAWFVGNVLFGAGSQTFGLSDSPVAWQAHIGGFLAGMLLFHVFDPTREVEPAEPPVAP